MVGPFGLRPKGTMAARALPLAQALARRGHRVTLVLPPWSWPEDSGRVWEDEGVRILNVVLPRAPAPLFHLQTTRRLLEATLAQRPDVVHCFKPKAYSGFVQAALWARRWRGRLVLDEDDWEGWGGWNDLEPYPWLAKQVFAWQEAWGLRHADVVTAASRALETLALAHGIPRERVVYLPNGAPPDAPAGDRARGRARWGLPPDAPVVLLYTRFFEYKVSRLLAVFKAVYAARPATRFLVVGNGLYGEEKELLAEWGRLSSQPTPQDALVYAGWTGDEALPDIFAASDVALYPLDDTLVNRAKSPAKLLQLLGAGVPVVADAVGQAAVYVGGAEVGGGVLVRPETPTAMAEAVVALLDDAERRAALASRARVWVQQHYSWPQLAQRLEQVYLGQTPTDALP